MDKLLNTEQSGTGMRLDPPGFLKQEFGYLTILMFALKNEHIGKRYQRPND